MKILITPVFLFVGLYTIAQPSIEKDKKAVMGIVNQFFKALEKKDTVLYNSVILNSGQIWTVRKLKGTLKTSMRSFNEDKYSLMGMNAVIEEKPLSFEIKIHHDIAIAWVPYTLSRSGKFSHCGVDVFTLIHAVNGWRIVNATYSVEPDGCDSLQKRSNKQ